MKGIEKKKKKKQKERENELIALYPTLFSKPCVHYIRTKLRTKNIKAKGRALSDLAALTN